MSLDQTEVRQLANGEWQEKVNGVWYDWNDRPLCTCKVEDDGDAESGPHLSIVEWDPKCPRHRPDPEVERWENEQLAGVGAQDEQLAQDALREMGVTDGARAFQQGVGEERWFVHKYEVRLNYGGPEEGGWWYESGTPDLDWDAVGFVDEDDAYEFCRTMNEGERTRRERDEEYEYHSVLAYKSRHYAYDVSPDRTPHAYPEHRPHYE